MYNNKVCAGYSGLRCKLDWTEYCKCYKGTNSLAYKGFF